MVLAKADSAFAITKGARVILSVPPAKIKWACPEAMAIAPFMILCNPLAHKRFTVYPGTLVGMPANNDAIRATLRLSSPAWFAAPKITSSISDRSMFGLRLRMDRMTWAARSSGRTAANVPPNLPTGVLRMSIT